ncbi:MAG: sodium ion-translocating decarboxylase subunit beta [Anaerolineae bacterium]|nr:sodium ion-translocating decarboxylase subunit beta [Anaerolineae bacterium]
MDLSRLLILIQAPTAFTWQEIVMILIGIVLIYLAIAKDYEPLLLLPIGFGAILTNLPLTTVFGEHGFLMTLYKAGIETELFPLLLFIGVGAMTDFGPLFENPKMVFLGAAGHIGIFITMLVALIIGYDIKEAGAIAAIGTMDGPTSIIVAKTLAPNLLAPIAVAAYSYMSLVPIIQPPVMKALTTSAERKVRMPYSERKISKTVRIVFPIAVTIIVSLIAPAASALIATIMLGNLMRESGVVERLTKASENEIANFTTLFLGLTIGASMTAESFVRLDTFGVIALGLVAFVFDMAGGVLFGKLLYTLTKGKFNPLLGSAGISAFPMAARVVQRVGQEFDYDNFLLMHAMGANVAGQLGSVVAGGVVLALLAGLI